MKWTPGSVSEDVEDRRGGGGGFRGGPVSIGVVLVLLVLSLLTGKNFLSLVDSGAAPAGDASADQSGAPVQSSPEEEKLVQFVSFVLDDAQHTWQQLLPGYRKAKLVLFRDATQTACGVGQDRERALLLSGRRKGLSRSRLLRRAAHAIRGVW